METKKLLITAGSFLTALMAVTSPAPSPPSKPLDPRKIKFAVLLFVATFAVYLVFRGQFGINLIGLLGIAGIVSFIILKPDFAAQTFLFILPIPAFVALAMFGVHPYMVAPAILLIIFAMFVMLKRKKGTLALTLNVLALILLLIIPNTLFQTGSKPYDAIMAQKDIAKKTWRDMLALPAVAKKEFEKQLAFATEDARAGEIDRNAKRTLGVFFDKFGTTSTKYTIPEKIQVFTTIRAETFKTDQNVSIDVQCQAKGTDIKGEIIPPGPFSFDYKMRQQVDCRIDSAAVGTGTPTIELSATFNFVTSAYQIAYFIDQELSRAYIREDIDPLDAFNITDKNPTTKHTSGPINIGFTIDPQPSPVSATLEYGPTPTLSIINEWNGDIKSIDEMTIISPPGLSIVEIDGNDIQSTCKGCGSQECRCTIGKELMNKLIKKENIEVGVKKFRLHTRITDPAALLGTKKLSIRNFIVTLKYKYSIKQEASVEVKEIRI